MTGSSKMGRGGALEEDDDGPGPLLKAPGVAPPPPKARASSFIYQPTVVEAQVVVEQVDAPLSKLECAHAKAVVRKMVDKLQLLNALPVDIVKRVRENRKITWSFFGRPLAFRLNSRAPTLVCREPTCHEALGTRSREWWIGRQHWRCAAWALRSLGDARGALMRSRLVELPCRGRPRALPLELVAPVRVSQQWP